MVGGEAVRGLWAGPPIFRNGKFCCFCPALQKMEIFAVFEEINSFLGKLFVIFSMLRGVLQPPYFPSPVTPMVALNEVILIFYYYHKQ